MKIPEEVVTYEELRKEIDLYVQNQCEIKGDKFFHKKCGGEILRGFFILFDEEEEGNPDPIGFRLCQSVPYCEKCDPPDGERNLYYARFVYVYDLKKRFEKNVTDNMNKQLADLGLIGRVN